MQAIYRKTVNIENIYDKYSNISSIYISPNIKEDFCKKVFLYIVLYRPSLIMVA